jgi:hypothetical protein
MPVVIHAQTSRTNIGAESTFGTVSSNMKHLQILEGDPVAELATQTAPHPAQVRRQREYVDPVQLTRKGSTLKLRAALKKVPAILNASATPVAFDHADALSHQLVMRAAFGGELTPAAGSTVASSSGTPVNSITVASGHGSRFVPGQVIIVTGEGPRRVKTVSTDTLTLDPPLSGTPSVGTVIRNCYCYHVVEKDSQTFSVEHAPVESGTPAAEMRALGCHGSAAFKFDVNALSEIELTLMAVHWQGPGDLSIGDAPSADDMGATLAWNPTVWLASSLATLPSASDEVATAAVTLPRKWQEVAGSTVNGVGSVHDVSGRAEPIDIDVEGLFDADWETRFTAGTTLSLVMFTTVGSGADARYAGLWFPTVRVVESPKRKTNEALLYSTAKLRAFMAVDIGGATPALSTAAIVTSNVVGFMG